MGLFSKLVASSNKSRIEESFRTNYISMVGHSPSYAAIDGIGACAEIIGASKGTEADAAQLDKTIDEFAQAVGCDEQTMIMSLRLLFMLCATTDGAAEPGFEWAYAVVDAKVSRYCPSMK